MKTDKTKDKVKNLTGDEEPIPTPPIVIPPPDPPDDDDGDDPPP